jgi:hypothetical protein
MQMYLIGNFPRGSPSICFTSQAPNKAFESTTVPVGYSRGGKACAVGRKYIVTSTPAQKGMLFTDKAANSNTRFISKLPSVFIAFMKKGLGEADSQRQFRTRGNVSFTVFVRPLIRFSFRVTHVLEKNESVTVFTFTPADLKYPSLSRPFVGSS